MAMAKADDGEKEAMGCVLLLLATPAVIGFRAFVVTRLWAWFAVPLGAPAVGLLVAVGWLLILETVFSRKPRGSNTQSVGDMLLDTVAFGFGVPALCWLVGWVVSLEMSGGF